MTDPILDPNHIANRILKGSVGWFELQEAHRTIIQQHIKSEADEVALGILRRNRDIAFNEGVEAAAKMMERWIVELDEPGSRYQLFDHERSEAIELLTRYATCIRLLKRPTGDLDP